MKQTNTIFLNSKVFQTQWGRGQLGGLPPLSGVRDWTTHPPPPSFQLMPPRPPPQRAGATDAVYLMRHGVGGRSEDLPHAAAQRGSVAGSGVVG